MNTPDRPWSIVGDETGIAWKLHLTFDRIESSGERYYARGNDGREVVIHRCEKGGMWDDEIERMRSAIALARRPEIRECPWIRQLIDTNETQAEQVGDWEIMGYLTEILEWADITVLEVLEDPERVRPPISDEVASNVSAALDVLHGVGIIHGDVAPNNILRVDGVWKLADLDSCVARGALIDRGPMNKRYLHPDREGRAVPARDEFDTWALDRVVEALRECGW